MSTATLTTATQTTATQITAPRTTATRTTATRTTAGLGARLTTSGRPRADRTGPRLLLPPVAQPVASATGRTRIAPAPVLRSVLSPVTEVSWPVPRPVVPDPAAPLPDPDQLCGSLVLAAVEVLAGARPLTQLARWVSPTVLEALSQGIVPATVPATVGRRPVPDAGRVDRGTTPSVARRATIRRTHLSRISPIAVEASVVVHDGSRVRAAALRLEVHRGHWRATVLQIG